MLDGISILCFSATYLVTLALEINRTVFGTGRRMAYTTFGVAIVGVLTHIWFLVLQARNGLLQQSAPLSSWYHWCLIAALALVLVYIAWTVRRPGTAFGLFVLPVSLLLILFAIQFSPEQTVSHQRASLVWGSIHGGALLLGTVAVCVGFSAGLMYLVQSYRLKNKIPPRHGFRLPSLEMLQTTNSRALVISSVLLAIGLLSGVLLNMAQPDRRLSWLDPAVISSSGLFLWLIAACLFNAVYKPVRMGKKVAYLTVASFVFLMLVLAITLLGPSMHGTDIDSSDVQETSALRLDTNSPSVEGDRTWISFMREVVA